MFGLLRKPKPEPSPDEMALEELLAGKSETEQIQILYALARGEEKVYQKLVANMQ